MAKPEKSRSILSVKNRSTLSPKERQQDCLRLINNVYADIVVCNIGLCSTREEMRSFVAEMDCIIFVIDPLPSKLIAGYDYFSEMRKIEIEKKKDLKNKGSVPEFVFVINKMNGGVNRKEVFSYLKLRNYVEIPMIEAEILYEAEYRCKVPIAISGARKKLSNSFGEIHKFITYM